LRCRIFGALFCGIYITSITVGVGFALVNSYWRKPPRLLLVRGTVGITVFVAAALVCIGALFRIDSRLT
jgi:hypothetical protein